MSMEMIQVEGAMTSTSNGSIAVAQSRAMAAELTAVQVAKSFPRDVRQSLARIKNACMRTGLASVATYTYSRGGTDISGPSIRLAEVLANNWGNIRCGIRELEKRDGESTVLAFCYDLETNTRVEKEFQVSHVIYTKSKGAKRLTDPRDIYEKVANDGARRLRACILSVIPKDIVDEAVETCEETLKANVEITKERLEAMCEKFSDYGVTREQIEKFIQRNLSAITPAQFLRLIQIFNSLKDGMSKPEDWFESNAAPSHATGDANGEKKDEPKNDLKSKLGIKGKKKDEKEQSENAAAPASEEEAVASTQDFKDI